MRREHNNNKGQQFKSIILGSFEVGFMEYCSRIFFIYRRRRQIARSGVVGQREIIGLVKPLYCMHKIVYPCPMHKCLAARQSRCGSRRVRAAALGAAGVSDRLAALPGATGAQLLQVSSIIVMISFCKILFNKDVF